MENFSFWPRTSSLYENEVHVYIDKRQINDSVSYINIPENAEMKIAKTLNEKKV